MPGIVDLPKFKNNEGRRGGHYKMAATKRLSFFSFNKSEFQRVTAA